MRLYKINNEIELALSRCIDSETGEIISEEYFKAVEDLKLNREEMILDIACLVKDYLGEAEKFQNEIEILRSKQKRLVSLAETQENLISRFIQEGEKIEDTRAKITWRKSESVKLDCDPLTLPERFIRTKVEADKTELKAALKSGENITGVSLESKMNMSIK